jgi:hypothetical protein
MISEACAHHMITALRAIAGGSFPGASTLAVNGDWKSFVETLQSIAKAAVAEFDNNYEPPDPPGFEAGFAENH